MATVNDDFSTSHVEALLEIGKAVGPITKRGPQSKMAAVRALCEMLTALVAADYGISTENDSTAEEMAVEAFNAVDGLCKKRTAAGAA